MRQGSNVSGPQYLEDLATGYWKSQVLFTAVELGVFNLLEPQPRTAAELADRLKLNPQGLLRFLEALCAMGLLSRDGELYANTKLSSENLVSDKANYQGESILWRKNLVPYWRGLGRCLKAGGRVDFGAVDEDLEQRISRIRKYISGMDSVARVKVQQILRIFNGNSLKGPMLDVGVGSGAVTAGFLKRYSDMTATLLDLAEVLEYTSELLDDQGLRERVTLCPVNILEDWPVDKSGFELIMLSNIIHAYAEEEVCGLLQKAAACLKPGGFLVIHDFFLEHYPKKAALMDLNMLINTYNGKVFSQKWVGTELTRLNLVHTGLIPLESDTGLIIASQENSSLAELYWGEILCEF